LPHCHQLDFSSRLLGSAGHVEHVAAKALHHDRVCRRVGGELERDAQEIFDMPQEGNPNDDQQ